MLDTATNSIQILKFQQDARNRQMNQINSESITLNATSILEETREFCVCHDEKLKLCQIGILRFVSLMLFAFCAPVILIWSGFIPFKYRFHASFLLLAVFILFSFIRRHGFRELGFRTDNLKGSILSNLVFCAAGAIGLFFTYKAGFLRSNNDHLLPYIYAIYVLFLGPVQEIVFRGILFAEMKKIRVNDYRWAILVSTISFCFLHLIYRHPPMLVITFISGLVWGLIYSKWPNIWGVSLSHSILGALAIFLGVI